MSLGAIGGIHHWAPLGRRGDSLLSVAGDRARTRNYFCSEGKMGTRADFYVGRGEAAEWIGSIAWDGYPDGKVKALFGADTEPGFRLAVTKFFEGREDVTLPADGWPWPWDDSQTTDYAYAFDGGKVWASGFGGAWFDPTIPDSEPQEDRKVAVFPKLGGKGPIATPGSKRSGIMVLGLK